MRHLNVMACTKEEVEKEEEEGVQQGLHELANI